MDTEPSVRTIGKYEVVGEIGRGGMGVVYRAVDPAIGRTVAIKMLKGGYANDPDLLQRFYREARSTGNLQHRNIVTVFALGDLDGIPYLVMEYLEGQSVSEIITSRRAMSLVEKLDLIVQICDGLHYAHCRNLIHRDIKPANVIVLPDGTSKIVDFGIARPTASQGLTQTGQVIGSPHYMSPEQINSQPLDARTDVFSTGVLLYELLTYELPFKGADAAATFMKVLSSDPPPLSKYLQDYPPELDEIVSRALAKPLDDRYQSAEELGFDLLQVQRELREGMTKFYLQVAESCIRRGDFERARLQLQEVLKLDRQNEGANRLLRQVRQAQQQQQRKSRVAQMRSQAQVALAGHQYEEALACAEQACGLDPTDIDSERLRDEIRNTIQRLQLLRSLLSRAESAMYAGELEDAKRSADEAVRLVPDDSQANALASAVGKELAARSRRAAMQNFVDNARQEISARNFVKAIDNLRQAEELDPGDSNVAELLRWANRGQEQEERRHALQEMLTHIDEALRTGDSVSACTMCDMGLAQFPSEPSLLKLKTIAERQREVARRRQFVQEQSVAARHLAEAGQHEAALQLLAEALRRYPEEPNLETLRALIGGELEMLTREHLERERQLAVEEAARQLAAEIQQRVLYAAAHLRGYLDEQQDFAAAANIASELQQFLSSEALDQKTRDVGTAILSEFQSRASAREQARKELEGLIEAADALNPVLRNQAGERALAIQAAYPNDQQIQAAYAAVTANSERWSQRRGKAIAELANIAVSLAQLPLAQAAQTKDRAEQIGAPFGSDPQIGSLQQQIRNECEKLARYHQRLLEALGKFKVRVTQTRSLVELDEVLDQAHSLVFSQQSDAEISSTFSDFKSAAEVRRRDMEALVSQTQQIAKQIEQAATVDLAENLLEKGSRLAADNPENLDVQEMVTRMAGQVRGRRAEHDLIVHELTSLHAIVSQATLAEDLALIRQRSAQCRAKHQRDAEIAALCNQIESEAGVRQFVQEQSVAASGLARAGQYQAALDLLADALRRYPNEPNLEKLQAGINSELEELTRERLERERQQAAEEAARRLAAAMQQRVLNAVADLRRCLDEQQNFAAAANIASELQQFLSSELLDHATHDAGMAIVSEYQSQATARERALKELHQLVKVSEDSSDSVGRRLAGERAQAIQTAYLKDQEIQTAYAAVTANLERWSQRRDKAIAELANVAKSLAQGSLSQVEQSTHQAEEIAISFGSDPEIGSLTQQIRDTCKQRARDLQRLLKELENFSSQIPHIRSLAELNDLLDQAHSRVSSQESDPAILSAFSNLKTAGDDRRRSLEALLQQAKQLAERVDLAATVDLAETLLDKGNKLAAANLDAQEVVTRIFTQVRVRRAEHDSIVQELASLQPTVAQVQSAEQLEIIRKRSADCRTKHQRDPKITALCDQIEAAGKRRKFVLGQIAAARRLAESGQHEAALQLLAEALRRYPEEPDLETLRALISGELETLTRERLEHERQKAAEEAARQLSAEMQQRVLSAAVQLRRCLDEPQDFAAASSVASELQQLLSSEVLDQATPEIGVAALREYQSRAAARERALEELQQLVDAVAASYDPIAQQKSGERARALQDAYAKDPQIQALYAAVTANLERLSQCRDKVLDELSSIAKSLAQVSLVQAERSRDRAQRVAAQFESDPQVGSLLQQIRNQCEKRARDRLRLLEALGSLKTQLSQTRSLAELNDVLGQAKSLLSSGETDSDISSTFSEFQTAADDRRRSMEERWREAQKIADQIDHAATLDMAEGLAEKGKRFAAANSKNVDVQEVLTHAVTQVGERRAEHDLALQELTSLQATLSQARSVDELSIILQRSADCRAKHQRDLEITAVCDRIEAEVRDRVDGLSKDVTRDVDSQDSAQSLEPTVIEKQAAAQSPDRESEGQQGSETILPGDSLSRDTVTLEEMPKASFPEPKPAHNRTPLLVGVAAIALLAVATVIWVHTRNKQEPFATVQITSLPEGASVHIRGTDKQCVTPRCTLELPAGNYETEAKLQDYQDAVEPIHVDAGAKSAITIRMSHTLPPGADKTAKSEPNPPPTPSAPTTPPAPVLSRLEIRHGTPNAEVIVDGKQQGRINRAGKISIELPSGDHQLKIVAGEKESSIILQHFGPGATVTLTGSDFMFPAPAQPAEQVAWQEIRNSQNPADFDQFLQRYPNSEYRSQAEGKLDELNWNRARSNETSASLRDYLNRFPNGRHSEDARGQLQRLDWASIASSTDPGVFEDFAKRYPSGVYNDKAVGQLDDLAWAHTRNDDLKSLQAYLKRFPKGKHADSATAALESLATVKPSPAPTPPTISDRPPALSRPAVDDRASIVSTLEEYRRAYNSKNLALLQTIWPGMTPKETKTTETFFQAARSVDLTYHITGGPDIVEDRAIVHFLVQVTYVASGKSETTKVPATMTLRKITTPGANTWQIESIK